MKTFYQAMENIFLTNNVTYGSRKNTNGEIKYNKLRKTSGAKISHNAALILEKEINDICSNYEVFVSLSVREGSYSITIAILDADYNDIIENGFLANTTVNMEYPEMSVAEAAKNNIQRITIKRACPECGDFRRFKLDRSYSCVTCYDIPDSGLTLEQINADQERHNKKVINNKKKYYAQHKPVIMYGYRP